VAILCLCAASAVLFASAFTEGLPAHVSALLLGAGCAVLFPALWATTEVVA
jgi:hypothetical protein